MLLSLLVALAAAAALPSASDAALRVGIAENNYGLFDDPRFAALQIKDVRVVAPFDVMRRGGFQRDRLMQYLLKARAQGVRPLVTFEHSAGRGVHLCKERRNWRKRQCRLPSPGRYAKDLRLFFRAFPWVRYVAPWNEANHPTQPTWRNPRAAARFANIAKRVCKRCTIVVADILDQADGRTRLSKNATFYGTIAWLRKYKRALRIPRKVCGLHNYSDVNRFRSAGTRTLVKALDCRQVWLTESGGLYHLDSFRKNQRRQARAIKWMFTLAQRTSPRIKRLYVYTWFGGMTPGFDSGLVTQGGVRRAFTEFRRRLRPTPSGTFARWP